MEWLFDVMEMPCPKKLESRALRLSICCGGRNSCAAIALTSPCSVRETPTQPSVRLLPDTSPFHNMTKPMRELLQSVRL